MNYQDVEQFWCKITASNDFLSQLACMANFEQQHPPGAVATGPLADPKLGMSDSTILLLLGAVVVLIAIRSYREGACSFGPQRSRSQGSSLGFSERIV
jgi:hypothetical protein